MTSPEVQQARDYNRGLAAPIRWAHLVWAAARSLTRPLRTWATAPHRRPWAVPLLWGAILAALVGSADGRVLRYVREHVALTEAGLVISYTVLTASTFLAAVIWIQDPKRRWVIGNWIAAFAATAFACRALAMLIGRPKPMFDDPGYFISPFGQYPITSGIRHAWEFWARGVSDLWSMPATDIAYSCAGAAVVAAVYPRLRAIAVCAAAAVGLGSLLAGGHYPSDLVAGAAIGTALGRTATARRWGSAFIPTGSSTG